MCSALLNVDFQVDVLHSEVMAKPALGRGLGALLGGTPAPQDAAPAAPVTPVENGERVVRVPLDRVRPSPFQPRKEFSPEALQELTDSIRAQGVIQPLLVRQRGEHFELIAGERRWRASQLVGLKDVPVIVREVDDTAVLELALIENLQRENLNPMEEAQGYSELIQRFQLRQEDVAVKVGKSRAWVANSLRLLKLPADIQGYVRDGRLSVGHAKVILALNDGVEQLLASERVLKQGLSVRATEELVTQMQKGVAEKAGKKPVISVDAHVQDLENKLRERFGTKVQLRYKQGKGKVEVQFFSDDELERILQIVGVHVD